MFIRLRTACPDDWGGRLTDLAVGVAALLVVPVVLLVRLPESWIALTGGHGWPFRVLLALAVVLVVVVALTLLATAAVARFAGGAPSAAGGPSNGVVTAAPTVVVQPGDTLWSIAADIAPTADVRITVDQLIALNGASPIVPGQELTLPG